MFTSSRRKRHEEAVDAVTFPCYDALFVRQRTHRFCKQVLEYDDHGNLLRHETQRISGDTMTVSCYEYIGTDGSISGSIPEE